MIYPLPAAATRAIANRAQPPQGRPLAVDGTGGAIGAAKALASVVRKRDALACSEPAMISTTYVSGIAHARVIGGILHVSYYIEQPDTYGAIERVIIARFASSVESAGLMRMEIDRAIAEAIRQPMRTVS
jgi:hypothetical protein